MTTKPELELGSHLIPGLAAVALFVVMAVTFLTASIPQPQGFAADANITASLGYAMFNLGFGDVASEGFLVAFEIIDLVLVAALIGSVMLARREVGESFSSAVEIAADGGRRIRETVRDDASEGGEK